MSIGVIDLPHINLAASDWRGRKFDRNTSAELDGRACMSVTKRSMEFFLRPLIFYLHDYVGLI